jgi:trimeric autotransporter adhesin
VQGLDAGEQVFDTYTFTATDGTTQQVTVTITGANDGPIAVADTGTATESGGVANATPGTPASGNVLTNDTDVDAGDTMTVSALAGGTVGVARAGAYGTLTLNADGSYTYLVDEANAAVQALRLSSQTLTDTFTYTVRDTAGLTDTANLVITIQGANDAPVAVNDSGSASEAGGTSNATGGSNATGNVLTNDTDVDSVANGETKTVSAIAGGTVGAATAGSYGSLTLNADGSYTYIVNQAAVEALRLATDTVSDTFTYTVSDAGGLTSTAVLTVTITGANDAPTLTIADNAAAITEDAWSTVSGRGTVVFSGVPLAGAAYSEVYNANAAWTGGALTPAQVAAIASGFDMTAAGWKYDVANADLAFLGAGEEVTFSFDVTATNGAASDTRTVSLKLVGTGGLPRLEVATTAGVSGSWVLVDGASLAWNDVDAGDTVTISSSNTAAVWTGGTLSAAQQSTLASGFVTSSSGWEYRIPNSALQFIGAGETVTLTYDVTATDLGGLSQTRTVAVVLSGVNDAPAARARPVAPPTPRRAAPRRATC